MIALIEVSSKVFDTSRLAEDHLSADEAESTMSFHVTGSLNLLITSCLCLYYEKQRTCLINPDAVNSD